MTVPGATLEDLEQLGIALDVLLNALVIALDKPGTLDRRSAASFLVSAADERERQGDYGAARVLDEWAQMVVQP